MSDIFFLVLRKLRTPLILLVTVYAVATLGMTLIPGVDNNGQPWHMSFFHAFYFVSFMGTTIGFGEIPYEFTNAQRAWVLVCIYISVISWLYAIGTMLSLIQDTTFRNAIANRAFQRSIRRIDLPFYIICGYGSTGALISKSLSEIGMQTVIIDHNSDRTNSLELQDLRVPPIVLTADTTQPDNLIAAGMNHPNCQGIIAVTENDHTNLQVALNCKLLNQKIPVICRSQIEDEAANMASFGTDEIINPFITFARELNLLAHNPQLHQIQSWFINQHNAALINERRPPKGRWIICGYGRLGKAIHQCLERDGIDVVVVDADPAATKAPPGSIKGRGTEASTLEEAGIRQASVIIAASDDDANNLSILITAEQMKANIYSIGRISHDSNKRLFVQAGCDYIMQSSQVVANQALTLISRPLVTKFIKDSNRLSTSKLDPLVADIKQLTDNTDPITWRVTIDKNDAPAFTRHIKLGQSLTIAQISYHESLPKARCIPLLLERSGNKHLLPSSDMSIELGDQLLFCGKSNQTMLPQRLRDNIELIDSLINQNEHYIPLLRWLSRRKSHS